MAELIPSQVFRTYVRRNALYALQWTQGPLPPDRLSLVFQALDFALSMEETWPQARALLLALAPPMSQKAYHTQWLAMLEQGLEQARTLGDEEAVMLLSWYAGEWYRHLTQYPQAQEHLTRALDLASLRDDRFWKAKAANRLASLAYYQGRFQEAERLIRLAQQNLAEEELEEQGYACAVLGGVRFTQRQWQGAYRYLCCALDRWNQTARPRLRAQGLMNLAPVTRRLGRVEEAAHYLEEAIATLEAEGPSILLGVAHMHLGVLLDDDADRPEEALQHHRRAEALFRRFRDSRHLAMATTNLGRAYFNLARWSQAIETMEQAMAAWEAQGDPVRKLRAQAVLIAALAKTGELSRAQQLLQRGYEDISRLSSPQREVLADVFSQVEARMGED